MVFVGFELGFEVYVLAVFQSGFCRITAVRPESTLSREAKSFVTADISALDMLTQVYTPIIY